MPADFPSFSPRTNSATSLGAARFTIRIAATAATAFFFDLERRCAVRELRAPSYRT
jgi:hypothetical protein